jgi:antirestriction protein
VWVYWEDHGNYPDVLDGFEDSWAGTWDSAADYAYDLAESSGDIAAINTYLRAYIDWDALARDMEFGGDITCHSAPGGGVWVFRSV